MSLEELLALARALTKDEPVRIAQPSPVVSPPVTCCKSMIPITSQGNARGEGTTPVRCYQCNKTSHLVRDCLGNEAGDETSAPVYSTGNR